MATFDEYFSPALIAAYIREAYGNAVPYLGLNLFPRKQKVGLDLAWIKGHKGAPISLRPSAFDAKTPFRDRIPVEAVKAEMPFFRDAYVLKEKDRQDILRFSESNPAIAQDVLRAVYNDIGELVAGADVAVERMIMSLLFPENGEMKISIHANDTAYNYDYDEDGEWKAKNYFVLEGGSAWNQSETADPINDIQIALRALNLNGSAPAKMAIMSQATFNAYASALSVIKRYNPNAVYSVTDNEAASLLERYLGIGISVYEKSYRDEDGVAHSFVPDGYVSLVPDMALGNTWMGTTPEEADLLYDPATPVSIVNNGVAIATEITKNPVHVNTFCSEIALPSFERMDDVAVLKVF